MVTVMEQVLVIDTDMRKGCMERKMCVDSKQGLVDYLGGQQILEQVIKS